MQNDSQENREVKTWNPYDYIFGIPKVELIVVVIATAIIFWIGKDYLPWPLAFLTTLIYGCIRQWQVRREFDRFIGRR